MPDGKSGNRYSGDGTDGFIEVFECFVGRKLYSYIYKFNYSAVIPGNGFHEENQ
jgi:hypothetical protein